MEKIIIKKNTIYKKQKHQTRERHVREESKIRNMKTFLKYYEYYI